MFQVVPASLLSGGYLALNSYNCFSKTG